MVRPEIDIKVGIESGFVDCVQVGMRLHFILHFAFKKGVSCMVTSEGIICVGDELSYVKLM